MKITVFLAVYLALLNQAPPGLFPYPRPQGGGGLIRPRSAISRTNGRIEPREAVFESSPQDLPKAHFRI